MPHPQDPKLEQLLTLAHVFGALQQPQEQQAQLDQQGQQARMQLAVHLLGLQQQGREGEADRALKASGLKQADEQFKQGDLTEHEKIAAQREAKDAQMKIEAQKNENNILDTLMRDPSVDPAMKLQIGKHASPIIAAAHQAHQTQVTQDTVNKMYPTVAAVASDPVKFKLVMDSLSPEVQAGISAKIPQVGVGATPTLPRSPDETPGYSPALAGNLGDAIKYFPIDTANLGSQLLFNKGVLPPLNLLNSLVGAPPIQRQAPTPRDYTQLLKAAGF